MIYAENILLCVAVPLLLSMLFIRGQARRFVLAFVVGMLVCLLAAYVSGYLQFLIDWTEKDVRVFLSPVVEELMKLLPMLIVLLLLNPEDEGLLLMAVGLGAGFATFENVCFLTSTGASNILGVFIRGAGSGAMHVVRGMAVGVMHIVSVAALSIGIITARRFRALSLPALTGAFSLSVNFHGLYNLLVSAPGASAYVGYALPLLAAGALYLPYRAFRGKES